MANEEGTGEERGVDKTRPTNTRGKREISREGVAAIDNVDFRNAIYIRFTEVIENRIRELHEEIQNQLRDEDTTPPFGSVGVAVLEMHVLTVSYFESVAFQFCRWALEVDNEVAEIVLDYSYADIPNDASLDKRNQITLNWYKNNSNLAQYRHVLKDAGYMEEIADCFGNVKDRRNKYVHHPENLLELNTWDEVVAVLIDCIDTVDGLNRIIAKYLPVHQQMYETFTLD